MTSPATLSLADLAAAVVRLGAHRVERRLCASMSTDGAMERGQIDE